MTYFTETICPICNSNLEHINHSRYDEYQCDNQCYSYWCGEFSHIHSFMFRVKDFVIRYVEDSKVNTKIMYLYKNGPKFSKWSGATYITTIPAIDFNWNSLDDFNERIKKLIIFS